MRSRFLGELRLVDLGMLAAEDTMLGVLPPFAAAPVPERAIDPSCCARVLRAIRERRALDVALPVDEPAERRRAA